MISTRTIKIDQLLSARDAQYVIPRYQRSYDWGTEQIGELVEDLMETMEDNKGLFLGTFIFQKSNQDIVEVVDGQQRLTTISIILIAIRQAAKRLDMNLDLQSLIRIEERWKGESRPKLIVSQEIQRVYNYITNEQWDGIFPEQIDGRGVKREVNKIKPVYDYVTKAVNGFSQDELGLFTKVLLTNTSAIEIEVNDDQDVFDIFERTNARGLDLSVGDLLKNHILKQNDDYFDKWTEIIENASGSLLRMLKYYYVSREGGVSKSRLYRRLKQRANTVGIDDFVDELYGFSRYYKMFQSNDHSEVREWLLSQGWDSLGGNEGYYKQISRSMQALNLFNVKQPIPLIFSAFVAYGGSVRNDKAILRLLNSIEKFHFINNVISGRIGNEVEKLYADYSKAFYNSDDLIALVDEFNGELKKKLASREEFVASFEPELLYQQPKSRPLIAYVFDRFNNAEAKGSQYVEIYNPDKSILKRDYNIEHILPQKYRGTELDSIENNVIDSIGNLLIISRHSNSELGSKLPVEKMSMLSQDAKLRGGLKYLDEFLAEYGSLEWDVGSIKKRANDLAERAYDEIWRLK